MSLLEKAGQGMKSVLLAIKNVVPFGGPRAGPMGRFLIDKSPSQTAASAHWANVDSCGPCGKAEPFTYQDKAEPFSYQGKAEPFTRQDKAEPLSDQTKKFPTYDLETGQDYSQDRTMKELFDSTMKK